MRIGFISTRLSGTDGVSLEVEKWSNVLRRMGHETFFCAGELSGYAAGGTLIPKLHFSHPEIMALNLRAFGPGSTTEDSQRVVDDIQLLADELRPALRNFAQTNQLDVIITQNAQAIPMNLPLGVALADLIKELSLPIIAHHHDFYWERERFQVNNIGSLLDTVFPPDLPTIQHVVINSIAQTRLRARRGLEASVVPNVYDFATPPPEIDGFSADFRQSVGLSDGDVFILQPTRVIQRKGIDMAIELVHRLDLPKTHLLITHQAGDEGLAYWHWLQREAEVMDVDLRSVADLIGPERGQTNGQKIYTLWDAYPHADLITYPSTYEGFGNALLEAIYFKRPVVVNRYPVYNADIRPLGFEFIELEGFVSEGAVRQTRDLLANPERIQVITEKNYILAQMHFSLEVLEQKLKSLLGAV